MKKFALSALALAATVGFPAASYAYIYYAPVVVPVCNWVWNGFAWAQICY